jgi:phosphoserine phosphatase RsbU/P
MSSCTLMVSGPEEEHQFELKPEGTVIGRSPDCGVTLDHDRVSRRHARIYQDPFGRWIIEDLGSLNGIVVCGEQKRLWSVVPGEPIGIGPFSLSLASPPEEDAPHSEDFARSAAILSREDRYTEITSDERTPEQPLALTRLKLLNTIIDNLAALTNPSELYPTVCESLVQESRTAALILRFPDVSDHMSMVPEILASRFGDSQISREHQDAANLPLSRKVLEAVLKSGGAVMAKSIPSADMDIDLTLIDDSNPRVVICSPLNETGKVEYMLYIDAPMEQVFPDTFEFVRLVSRQIVAARRNLLLTQMRTERSVLDKQLEMAREIQSRLIPREPMDLPGVDLAMSYQPAMWVGGDYYDVWLDDNGKLIFVVGDVCGKGLPAAIVMSNLQAALRITMSYCPDLADAMQRINTHLLNNLPEGMFVTLFLGVFDPSTASLEYVNAGHLQPLLIQPDSDIVLLGAPDNVVLGIVDSPFRASVEIIPKGGGLMVFTDGITETLSPESEELFETERVAEALKAANGGSAKDLISAVTESVEKYRQSLAQHDDITTLCILNHYGD